MNYNDVFFKYKNKFQEYKSKKNVLQTQVEQNDLYIKKIKEEMTIWVEARSILTVVSSETQKKFIEYIRDLGTMALQSVFGFDYKFIVEYKVNKDSWDCLLLVQEGENEPFIPKNSQGSGILDILSLALRIVLWSIKKPASRAFLYLDEPLKAVGYGELLDNAINMMKNLSKKLGIQMIINTHEDSISMLGDKTFKVNKKNGISSVEVISGETSKEILGKRRINRR